MLHTPMMVAEQRDELQSFFDVFARAVTSGDVVTLASLWETPALVIGDEGVVAVANSRQIEEFFGGAKAQYNERGVFETRAEIQSVDWATDRVVTVEVRWPWLDAEGRVVGAEASSYTLRRDDRGALKLRAVVMRGADLSH